MVGHDSRSANLTHTDIVIAGTTSSFVTRAVCQPLDVLKIRFQLQVEPVSNSPLSKYKSIVQATGLIIREEGFSALWKGHVPAQLLSVVYGACQFWAFEVLSREAYMRGFYSERKIVANFACGSIAGCFGTIVSFPFDVARTRLVGQSEHCKIYKGFVPVFIHIWKTEGYLGFFRGLFPTLLQVAPHAGVQFMCFKLFQDICRGVLKENDSFMSSSIISGSLAGLCAKTSIYPFDLMKKRMQIQGIQVYRTDFGKIFVCNGMLNCFVNTIRGEGFRGLFKGLSASLLKAVVTSALYFTSYEVACKVLVDLKELKVLS